MKRVQKSRERSKRETTIGTTRSIEKDNKIRTDNTKKAYINHRYYKVRCSTSSVPYHSGGYRTSNSIWHPTLRFPILASAPAQIFIEYHRYKNSQTVHKGNTSLKMLTTT
jgi:hypothetical protein